MKSYSDACEQNKQPILNVLREYLAATKTVLEIGSGTGQHAVFFAQQLPHLQWLTSDLENNHAGIHAWLAEAQHDNIALPIALDVNQTDWLAPQVDAIYSANTVHIMDWRSVENLFRGIGHRLEVGGVFCLYGPFNYHGTYTSDSNARFDAWLKARDPLSGVRDFEALNALARSQQMSLHADHEMPANNRILVWKKA